MSETTTKSDTISDEIGKSPDFCLPVKSEEDFLEEQAQLGRAAVYELLGSLFASPPDESRLQGLRDITGIDPEQGQVAMGWELLKQASCKVTEAQVKDEHFSLFTGVGRGELVPFGSWYMTGFLMEKPVAVLRGDLKSLGIERESGVTDSEDHIAALCDAMAIIIRNPSEVGFERQKQFFLDHIEPWGGRFFADLQSADSAHFYRSVGFFAQSIFDFEKEYFAMQA